ncbi:MAG: hypothetical protein QOF51_1734 [Chloroflexota bacterium]|jgi:mannose-6-phosphate isomerase-like protein (cupin superfamily)|nr:hypothetical protein [Chloroflexota bacterium]
MPDAIVRFRYPGRDAEDGRDDPRRKHFYLCQTDRVVSEIQVMAKGAHNSLHSHATEDGVWIVLAGAAIFYGEGDIVIAELGTHEGVLLPAGTKYWFESTSDEPLEILRVDYQIGSAVAAQT